MHLYRITTRAANDGSSTRTATFLAPSRQIAGAMAMVRHRQMAQLPPSTAVLVTEAVAVSTLRRAMAVA